MEDWTEADPTHHRSVEDDDTNADQVAAQYRDDFGQQLLDRASAFGRQQPYRSGCEAWRRNHEIGHQHQCQKTAEYKGCNQPSGVLDDSETDHTSDRISQRVEQP